MTNVEKTGALSPPKPSHRCETCGEKIERYKDSVSGRRFWRHVSPYGHNHQATPRPEKKY